MRIGLTAVVGLVAMAIGQGAVQAADGKPDLELKLSRAITDAADAPRQALLLDLRRSGEGWERLWGLAGRFNTSWHYGYVTGAQEDAARLTLELYLRVLPDTYKRSTGVARYRVELARGDKGEYTGTFTGTCLGIPVEGQATAVDRAKPPQVAGVAPAQAGEHPRLLFRKGDLPALRKKMGTPFGKAMLGAFPDDAIALGVRYQLTGEKKYADEAAAFVERLTTGSERTQLLDGHHQSVQFGWFYEQAAQAYDLCYDAWTAEQRRRAENYLLAWGTRLVYAHAMYNTQIPRSIGNGEYLNMVFGAALGSLAMLGEKSPEPEAPPVPDPIVSLPPAAGYTPPDGVPVNPLTPGKFPKQWLALPAIRGFARAESFADIAAGKAYPAAGTQVTCFGAPLAFAPLAPEFIRGDDKLVINVGKALSPNHVKRGEGPEWAGLPDAPATFVLFTVLDNAEPRTVKLDAGFTFMGKPDVFVAGHYLSNGQVVKLDKGLYPMLVVARVMAHWDTLSILLQPATEGDMAGSTALMAQLAADHADRMLEWKYDRDEWTRTGGANPEYTRFFQLFQAYVYRHIQEGVGIGGAQPDHSGNASTRELGSGRYASAYLKALGHNLSPHDDLNVFLARKVFQRLYTQGGILAQEPSGGPTEFSGAYVWFHWPIIPEALKPAMLWAWQREFGIADPAANASAVGAGHPEGPVYAFVNYPPDLQPREPKGIFPLVWKAPTQGYYGFRSGWNGDTDFVAQVFAKAWDGKGYDRPNAGTFRIMGLGEVWADALPSLRLHNQRVFDPLVQFLDDDTNEDACGRVVFEDYQPDGSGALTIDMNDVYATAKKDAKGKSPALYERYGGGRNADAFAPSGITGLRAFAVDYSGKSGAPCLFVLVDRIDGGKKKLWAWHLKPPVTDPKTGAVIQADVVDSTVVSGNSALVTQRSGATMKLTAVAPAKGVLKAEPRSVVFTKTYNRGEGTYRLPGIFLQGEDESDGHFFVIATIQPKGVAAPEVKVSGSGLDAKVTVGGRTVSFNGEKVAVR